MKTRSRHCLARLVVSIIRNPPYPAFGETNEGSSGGNHLLRVSIMYNAIRQAVIKFEQDFMGRGPTDVRAFIIRDMVVVRLKGVLTQAERQLAKKADGVDMVKLLRQKLIAQGRDNLCSVIAGITGVKVTGLFTDIDTQIGERIMVFTLDQDLDALQGSGQ